MLPARDAELIQIVDASLASATARAEREDGTSWLACRPGCTFCCHGVFRISALDAARLQAELATLRSIDPDRAAAVQARAQLLVDQWRAAFPGDAVTGVLHDEDERWDEFADLPETDLACPVLDPASGRCELYSGRPLTCRVFGPPVQNEDGIGTCELCYIGAPETEVVRGEMHLQHRALEDELNALYPATETLIAWAVRPQPEGSAQLPDA